MTYKDYIALGIITIFAVIAIISAIKYTKKGKGCGANHSSCNGNCANCARYNKENKK